MKSENKNFVDFFSHGISRILSRKAKGENDEKCFLFHQQNFFKDI